MQPGAEQLKQWMDRRGFNQTETGAYFGWDMTFISQLVTGRRNPGLANAIRLERETGIPVEAWVPSEVDKPKPVALVRNGKRRQDKA